MRPASAAGASSPFGEPALACWSGSGYVAAAFQQAEGVVRFSIAREGYGPAPLSWEELMQVKRACGFADLDAVEVYPRDADIFNTGNIRHLYFIGTVPFALRANTHRLPGSNPLELKEP